MAGTRGLPATGRGAGMAGTGGSPTTDGAAGNQSSDFDTLSTCSTQSCTDGPSFAQLIENSMHNISSGLACVLRALRDRTPGRYEHETDSTFSNGNMGADHVLVVPEDGSVVYARSKNSYIYGGPVTPPPPEPTQRCQLKPAAYFSACLAALERPAGDAEAWACAYGGDGSAANASNLHWFESCATESPVSCR